MFFGYRTIIFYGWPFQDHSPKHGICDLPRHLHLSPQESYNFGSATDRAYAHCQFGLFPVRSPLLRESRSISFPPGTKMFQFPGLSLQIAPERSGLTPEQVSPFGNSRVTGCLLLTGTFRSLPRPSSTTSTKVSTICPFYLGHIISSRFQPAAIYSRSKTILLDSKKTF